MHSISAEKKICLTYSLKLSKIETAALFFSEIDKHLSENAAAKPKRYISFFDPWKIPLV